METSSVYRIYDAQERLLYVGCSCRPAVRMADHRKKKWGPDIHFVSVTKRLPLGRARELERNAIITEHPKYNRTYLTPPEGIVKKCGIPLLRGSGVFVYFINRHLRAYGLARMGFTCAAIGRRMESTSSAVLGSIRKGEEIYRRMLSGCRNVQEIYGLDA